MDHQFPSFPTFFAFVLFTFMILRIRKKSKTNNSTPNLPPGPLNLPLIGSLHHLVGYLPHHRLGDLAKKYGPIMYLQLGELPHVVVSSPEAAKEVMKTHDVIFASRPPFLAAKKILYNSTNIGLSPYGDYWRQLRKICTVELLTAKRVQSFGSIRREEVSRLVTSISSKAGLPINFSRMFSSLTFSIISRAAFGKIWKGEDEFIPAIKEMMEIAGGFTLTELYPSIELLQAITPLKAKIEKIHAVTDMILKNIIDDHRARRAVSVSSAEDEAKDLVDVLLDVQEHGDLEFPLTTDNLKAVILDMFIGGTETSSTTVVWAMSELLRNPRAMQKVQAEVRQAFNKKGHVDEVGIGELNYLKAVIKETLRLHPPLALLIPRESREASVLNGYDIPVKTKVIVNAWAIGRDPNYWTDAEKFCPERFIDRSMDYKGTNFEFIPFGAGRRICPGMLFGLANVEFPLAQLLYGFDWKLPNEMQPENLDMTEHFGAVVGRKNDLHAIPIPHLIPPVN